MWVKFWASLEGVELDQTEELSNINSGLAA